MGDIDAIFPKIYRDFHSGQKVVVDQHGDPDKTGTAYHAAVYYGADNSGLKYYYTKNGGKDRPIIMSGNQLKSHYNRAFQSKGFKYHQLKLHGVNGNSAFRTFKLW